MLEIRAPAELVFRKNPFPGAEWLLVMSLRGGKDDGSLSGLFPKVPLSVLSP